MQPADDSAKLLVVEEVNLEIQVAVSRQGNAGLNVQVVQLGGSAKRDDTHTVKVKLAPLLSHEERVKRLQEDPSWNTIVSDSVEYTVKGTGDGSQLGQ